MDRSRHSSFGSLLDRLLWTLVGLLPAAPPADWLRVPTDPEGAGTGTIGADWPARRAAAIGASFRVDPDGGLLPDVSSLTGAERLHPLVREFYTHTARFSMAVEPRWWPGTSLAGRLWGRWFARRWGQLELPLSAGEALTNEIWMSGEPDPCRWWVRCYPDARVLYVSRYALLSIAGEPDVVHITFPVPGGAWIVVFRAVVDGEALVLTEQGGRAGGPGFYLVPAGGAPVYFRPFREEIRVAPTADGCLAVHRFWFLGLPFLTLSYEIPLSEARGTA